MRIRKPMFTNERERITFETIMLIRNTVVNHLTPVEETENGSIGIMILAAATMHLGAKDHSVSKESLDGMLSAFYQLTIQHRRMFKVKKQTLSTVDYIR